MAHLTEELGRWEGRHNKLYPRLNDKTLAFPSIQMPNFIQKTCHQTYHLTILRNGLFSPCNDNVTSFMSQKQQQNNNFMRVTILGSELFSPCGDDVTSFTSQKYIQTLQISISPKILASSYFLNRISQNSKCRRVTILRNGLFFRCVPLGESGSGFLICGVPFEQIHFQISDLSNPLQTRIHRITDLRGLKTDH